ncbi:hypothetical protein B4086_5655 [Bacillus cereus]|nr:hypothetical protein B4086_5655 [Bacillus cereus]
MGLMDTFLDSVFDGFVDVLPSMELVMWAYDILDIEAEKEDGFQGLEDEKRLVIARHPVGIKKLMDDIDGTGLSDEDLQVIDTEMHVFFTYKEGTRSVRVGSLHGKNYELIEDDLVHFNPAFTEDVEERVCKAIDFGRELGIYGGLGGIPLTMLKRKLEKELKKNETARRNG